MSMLEHDEPRLVSKSQPGVTEAFGAMRQAHDDCRAALDMIRDTRRGLVDDISAVLLPEGPEVASVPQSALHDVPEGSAVAVGMFTFAQDLRELAQQMREEARRVAEVRTRVNL